METAMGFYARRCFELESDPNDMPEWMIDEAVEFARMHVKAALEAANKKTFETFEFRWNVVPDSYPLTNIVKGISPHD